MGKTILHFRARPRRERLIPSWCLSAHRQGRLPACSSQPEPMSQLSASHSLTHSVNYSVNCLIKLRLRLMLRLRPRGSSCVGPRAPLTLTPSIPRGPALNFVDGAWHVCMPTGTFCRPTGAGLCVGLTRGRGPCDVNASAVMVKIPSIMAFSDPEQPRVQGLPLLSRWIMRDFFLASHPPHLRSLKPQCTRYPPQHPPPLSYFVVIGGVRPADGTNPRPTIDAVPAGL